MYDNHFPLTELCSILLLITYQCYTYHTVILFQQYYKPSSYCLTPHVSTY